MTGQLKKEAFELPEGDAPSEQISGILQGDGGLPGDGGRNAKGGRLRVKDKNRIYILLWSNGIDRRQRGLSGRPSRRSSSGRRASLISRHKNIHPALCFVTPSSCESAAPSLKAPFRDL
ncbi:hypothetical protein MPC4_10300 [Methylocella tundrae]|uniref:Uncharacterized protein n=1 Tax=Methylocella tundrae TaxID=227605 RepID=A0A8B6M288_METTU|nr:hypothetical protein MPC1_1170006 [Methylocella tundrae]VTZ48350.1 hypothetical protein MPC4_10300 [Methylocella tundrae]